MAEAATVGLCKNLRPIKNVFKPDALPEVYNPKIAVGDERLFVPCTETVSSKPL